MFNAEKVRDEIVKWLKEYANQSGFSKVVIGISGGKDSTITAALCARALGPQNVYGVMLPDGEQADIEDSILVCKSIGIPNIKVNIRDMHENLLREIDFVNCDPNRDDFLVDYSKEADINVPPRLRMTVLRYITQALGARLVGTDNLSEITVGYFTKDGDQSCDFSLLGDLTSLEVVQIGLTMPEIPAHLVTKIPSDGLCGLSDEEKLGVSYKDIHEFIRNEDDFMESNSETYNKILDMCSKASHKIIAPRTYKLTDEELKEFYNIEIYEE